MTDPPTETSVAEAIDAFRAAGYGADFTVTPEGVLLCASCRSTHAPSEAAVRDLVRVEGSSDPDEEAAVYALECIHCGTRGVLVLPYGPGASAEEEAVVTALIDRRG